MFKKISAITDPRYQFTKAGNHYEVLLVAAGGSGTPDCRTASGQKNGFNGIGSSYYSPDNFVGYSTSTNGTTSCNSIEHWINNDLIGILGGYSTDNLVYGGYGGGSQGGNDIGYFGGGWKSTYTTKYYETTEDEITQTTASEWYMGQSWSFSSGEYTKGKNGVTGKAIRHGAFEIQELKGEGLIETEGGGKEKYLSDNGKYEEVDAIKSLSISGRTITYTKRDGTQGSLVTQDTNTDTHYTARLYIGGNTGGSNAPTSNGGTYLKLYENGTVRDAKLIKGTGKTKVSSDSLGNVTVDTSVNEITEINADYIRITDLSTGIYKLRYAGTKYIYYSGTSGMGTINVYGSSGAVILTVNRYASSYWTWNYINNNGGSSIYLCYGYTNSSSGSYRRITLPSVQAGTLALNTVATTSVAGLMSAADKTKLDFPNSTSETWYLQDNSCYVNAKAFTNKPGGYVKIYGQVSLRTSNGPTYGILNIGVLASKFGMTNIIKKEKFMQGWWTYTRATNNSADLTGYGTSIWTDVDDDYLRFGRVYTSSGGAGPWARADIAGNAHYGTVSFEVYFRL